MLGGRDGYFAAVKLQQPPGLHVIEDLRHIVACIVDNRGQVLHLYFQELCSLRALQVAQDEVADTSFECGRAGLVPQFAVQGLRLAAGNVQIVQPEDFVFQQMSRNGSLADAYTVCFCGSHIFGRVVRCMPNRDWGSIR